MKQVFEVVPPSGSGFWLLSVALVALFAGLLGVFAYMLYSASHIRCEVSAEGLAIKGGMYGRTIPLSQLVVDQAAVVDLNREHGLAWRTNGIGMPGYAAGWFKTNDGDKALAFVTERSRVVRVPTRANYTLLLSVARPNEFLATLRGAR